MKKIKGIDIMEQIKNKKFVFWHIISPTHYDNNYNSYHYIINLMYDDYDKKIIGTIHKYYYYKTKNGIKNHTVIKPIKMNRVGITYITNLQREYRKAGYKTDMTL